MHLMDIFIWLFLACYFWPIYNTYIKWSMSILLSGIIISFLWVKIFHGFILQNWIEWVFKMFNFIIYSWPRHIHAFFIILQKQFFFFSDKFETQNRFIGKFRNLNHDVHSYQIVLNHFPILFKDKIVQKPQFNVIIVSQAKDMHLSFTMKSDLKKKTNVCKVHHQSML